MTEEKALELCQATSEEIEKMKMEGLEWSDADVEYSGRELRRSVRYISDAADLMSREHLLLNLDSLPRWAGVGGAPKLEKLIASLIGAGYCAARLPDLEPLLITDAPFDTVLEQVRNKAPSTK
jgi:hypothetical protein